MKRTVLLRLIALAAVIVVVVAVAAAVYNSGFRFGGPITVPAGPLGRGMPLRGGMHGWGGYGPGSGFGLFELLGFVLVGLLVVWLVAALMSDRGRRYVAPEPPAGALDQLNRLAEMHTQGHLTDDEFTAAKRKLLGL
jgi:uncharacterized membrane protein